MRHRTGSSRTLLSPLAMMAKEISFHDPAVREVREQGRAMDDRALLEVNVSVGGFSWANDFALATLGYTQQQLCDMSVFDLCPSEFHERLREEMTEAHDGRTRRFSVRPMRTAHGAVCWWYVYQVRSHLPLQWVYAEHVQNTPTSGPEFSFMSMQMETVNSQAALEARIEDLDDWVREQISRVDQDVLSVRGKLEELVVKTDSAISAAKNAATNALDAKNAANGIKSELDSYFRRFEEYHSQHAGEILKLISTDTLHDRRIEAFEEHVKTTTELAVAAIERQANRAASGLSRRVTVPVGVIAAVATALQLLLQHWSSIASLLR